MPATRRAAAGARAGRGPDGGALTGEAPGAVGAPAAVADRRVAGRAGAAEDDAGGDRLELRSARSRGPGTLPIPFRVRRRLHARGRRGDLRTAGVRARRD